MAKISQAVLLLATAICISSLGSFVYCHDKAAAPAAPDAPDAPAAPDAPDGSYDLMVIGRVYCDTCNAGFITPISEGVEGVNVTIVCKDREDGHVTYTVGAVTDARGVYQIPVKGDHAEEVCDIEVQQSPRPDCDQLVLKRKSSRIRIGLPITYNGIVKPARYVKPLGFLKKEPLDEKCPQVLAKMGLQFSPLMS